jgi:hypothetical protein
MEFLMEGFKASQAAAFLRKLYAGCPPDEWISVFAIDRTGTQEHPEKVLWGRVGKVDTLVKDIAPYVGTCCIWYGVATRKSLLNKGRGGVNDCAHLPALFADIDLAGPSHKATNYPPDLDAVTTLLSKFEPPDFLVGTGGGFHPYWVLDEPLATSEAALALHEWGNALIQRAGEFGWKMDQVFNLDRILRLPFTWNRKTELEKPIPVTLLETN